MTTTLRMKYGAKSEHTCYWPERARLKESHCRHGNCPSMATVSPLNGIISSISSSLNVMIQYCMWRMHFFVIDGLASRAIFTCIQQSGYNDSLVCSKYPILQRISSEVVDFWSWKKQKKRKTMTRTCLRGRESCMSHTYATRTSWINWSCSTTKMGFWRWARRTGPFKGIESSGPQFLDDSVSFLFRHYFVNSTNVGEQFFMFTSLAAWLIRKGGNESYEMPQEV